MPRKSTPRAGAESTGGNVIDRTDVGSSIPPTPSESRPGSVFSLEMVNVFGEPSAESTGAGPGVRLELTAWVNNVSYLKDVWVDAYLTDASGAVVHRETLLLDYREGAGGGGDFFTLDAPIGARGARGTSRKATTTQATSLQYRLYYQIGDTVFAEGILHELGLGTPSELEITPTPADPQAGETPPVLTARATPRVIAATEGTPAKKTARGSRASKKTAAPASYDGEDGDAPPKRGLRRRPSA